MPKSFQKGNTKILYITFNGITDPLGQSQVLAYLKDLSRQGITFYLVSLEKNLKEAKKLSKDLAEFGINWYRLKYFRFYFFGMALNIFQCFLLVFYLVVFKKIKIIHARAYTPIFSVLLLKKLFPIKIIFDMRGFWPEQLVESHRIQKNSMLYKALKFLEKQSILSSDYIVTLTPESKEIIKQTFKVKNVVWMPTCVDDDKFKNRQPISFGGKFIMIYSGSLWSMYDTPAAIDFFKVLKSKIPAAHFLILANNGLEKLYELFVQKCVQKQDYTITSVASMDVPKYLASSNLGISFRYDFDSEKASFPTKLAEYLMSGLPVAINSKSDYIKKLVQENNVGSVLETLDDTSYQKAADQLLALLQDKDVKERCIQVAQNHLSKRVCVNKYLNIYNELSKL